MIWQERLGSTSVYKLEIDLVEKMFPQILLISFKDPWKFQHLLNIIITALNYFVPLEAVVAELKIQSVILPIQPIQHDIKLTLFIRHVHWVFFKEIRTMWVDELMIFDYENWIHWIVNENICILWCCGDISMFVCPRNFYCEILGWFLLILMILIFIFVKEPRKLPYQSDGSDLCFS